MTNDEAKAMFLKGMALFDEGDPAAALAIMEALDGERPKSRHITHYRTKCLIALGRTDEAEACYHELAGQLDAQDWDALTRALAEAREAKHDAPDSVKQGLAPVVDGVSLFLIESVYPLSTERVSVMGHVQAGVFSADDRLVLVAPEGANIEAPIVRLGVAAAPLAEARRGESVVMLLDTAAQNVVPGSAAGRAGDAPGP